MFLNRYHKSNLWLVARFKGDFHHFSRAVLLLIALRALCPAGVTAVLSSSQSAIQSAISSACNGTSAGTVVFPAGTYDITSAVKVPGNCTLQAASNGQVTLSANQTQILEVISDNVTIQGFTFKGGWVAFANANSYTNFTFSNNRMQDLVGGGIGGGPIALSGPGLIDSTISSNSFFNLWGGGGAGYPNTPQIGPCPGGSNVDCWGSGAISFHGLDHVSIINNAFDEIASDGMHIDWVAFTGYLYPRATSGNTIAYNTFTRVRRIPIELQAQPSPCPGGCNYSAPVTKGLQVKGNYIHDFAFPFYDTWGASLVPDGALNPEYINNTFIANPGDQNGYAACMESSSRNGLTQGNVCASTPGAQKFFGTAISQGGGSSPAFTSTYQNNIFCGNQRTTTFAQEPNSSSPFASRIIDQYNYRDPNSCPAATSLTDSNITAAFTTTPGQRFQSDGRAIWSMYVVSPLSVKYVQFFLDGSRSPVSTQEIQDVNTNFANDLQWLYHAAIDTSSLTAGRHTVSAEVTDVSGATKTISETFNR